jgi:hypothetical protein
MGMFAGMLVGRTVAAKRNPAFLAGTQVHPGVAGFNAFLAYIIFGVFQLFYST